MISQDKMKISTGLMDLDILLAGLNQGDNVVWRVDSVADYRFYVDHLTRYLRDVGSEVYYFRFADHPPLLSPAPGITIIEINPLKGFEQFIVKIYNTISHRQEGNYIFDSISDLPHHCFSDRMVGNFFKVICPYLHRLNSFAYFSYMRYKHSFHAEQFISDTAQVLIDIYSHHQVTYIKPFQVKDRYSPCMFRLHKQNNKELIMVKESLSITEVLTSAPWPGLRSASYRMIGLWDRMFLRAEEVLEDSERDDYVTPKTEELFSRLLRIILSRDEKVLSIAGDYMSLKDLIYLWKRMIGTGFIGGKSVGILLAHAVLRKKSPEIFSKLEKHDSFYIGSDVFYTYLIDNDLWLTKQEQKNPDAFLSKITAAKKKIMKGSFPSYIVQRLADMLDYYGQTPIIVRSSSLLEDAFGNAFAGKYESVFCPNQGTQKKRLENLLKAIKTVYASAMSREALLYRKSRGVLDQDDQMPLLIQRVSGIPRGSYYYPQLSGVGFSFNPYAWSRDIDPKAGMLRLVYGMGTRAVDRSDNDYTRVIALNVPQKRPESDTSEKKKYSQKNVDLINLQQNIFEKTDFQSISNLESHLNLFATQDWLADRYYREKGITGKSYWFLSFEKLIEETDFISDMSEILETIKDTYNSNIDIEFTCNFFNPVEYKICLVQCRPFQVNEHDIMNVHIPDIGKNNLLMRAYGAIVGRSSEVEIGSIIFVDPLTYGILPDNKRYDVARIISTLLRLKNRNQRTVLIGPGRWGTSTPSLGVPVTFSEISSAYAICEIDSMHEGLVPDLSLGTHFFNEMVETGMVYMGYFGNKEGNLLRQDKLRNSENKINELLPESSDWSDIIYVIDYPVSNTALLMAADPIDQVGVLYYRES